MVSAFAIDALHDATMELNTTRLKSAVEKPSIGSIDFGNKTELVVRIKPVDRAKTYDLRQAVVGQPGVPGPWESVGMFTKSGPITVTGLKPLTTYTFQVRAFGASGF